MIRRLSNDKFQLKSITKLMEDLDVSDEAKNKVWRRIRNDIPNTAEFQVLSDEDECDILLINMEEQGIAVVTVEGGYGMFQPVFLPMSGKRMKAVLDKEEMLHIFVVRNDRLWHVQEKAPHSRLFTEPEEMEYVRPNGFKGVANLLVHPLSTDKGFVVGVVTETHNASYWVSYRVWEESSFFNLIQSSFSSAMMDFAGTEVKELSLECLSGTYTSFSVAQRKVKWSYRLELNKGDEVECLCTYGKEVFALLKGDGGHVPVEIRTDKTSSKARAVELTRKGSYQSLSMYTDADGKPYMALSGERLDYLRLEKNEEGYGCVEMMPLDKACTRMSFNGNPKCQRLFYLTDDGKVHVLENQDNVTWRENVLDVPDKGEIRRIPCYSTEMTFTRADNRLVPLQDIEVTLWAESRTYVETAQGIVRLDTDICTTLRTDRQGKISFKQYTNGLDVPVVYASLTAEYCPADEVIAISQFADIQEELAGITSDELMKAQQTDSLSGMVQPFLPDNQRNEKTAGELAASIQSLMQIKPQGNGLCMVKKGMHGCISSIVACDGLPSWSLDFSTGMPVYRKLTREDAQQEIALMRARAAKNGNGFFSKIADFFRSVIKGFVSIVKIVVDGVKTVVNFILDGVEMIFEAVITVVQEVFHFVEMVFAAILIFFVTVFAWLASLFVWNDVMRTKRAMKEGFLTILTLLPNRMAETKTVFQEQIDIMADKMDEFFDAIMKQLGADMTINAFTESQVPAEGEETEYELSNNPLMAKFNSCMKPDCLASANGFLLGIRQKGVLDDFIALLKNFITETAGDPAFQEAEKYFDEAFADIDKFLSSLLCGIFSVLKGIAHLILNGIETLVSAALDLAKALTEMIKEIADSEIDIPFFSSLYEALTSDKLTILNFVAFITSLPALLIYKVTYRKAPFGSEEEVDAFVAELQQAFGNGQRGPGDTPATVQSLCTAFSAVSAGMLGFLNSIISIVKEGSTLILDVAAVVCEWIWMAMCTPWIYDNRPRPYSITAWGYFLFCAIIDAGMTFFNRKYIDKDMPGNMIVFAYGTIHMAIAVAGILADKTDEKELSAVGFAGELTGSITEMSKIMLTYNPEPSAPDFVVSVIDLIGAVAIPTCICLG